MKTETPKTTVFKTKWSACLMVALFSPLSLIAQVDSDSKDDSNDEDIYELSPFSVDVSSDQGYYSAQTLAGGRLNTSLKDVATTVQVVTEEMLDDIGATGLDEVLVYTTNTDVVGSMSAYTAVGESGDGDGGLSQSAARQNPGSANRVRGMAAATRTANYFETSIPFDSYNVGRLDINRGANSFLFGLGSPGGIINTSLDSASFRDSLKVNFQFSTEEFEDNLSTRGSVNLNKVLVEDKLAVRVALMESEKEFMQKPAYVNDSRKYIAVKFKPFKDRHIVLNANYEKGDISSVPVDRLAPTQTLDLFLNDPYGTVWGSAGDVTNAAGRRVNDPFANILANSADAANTAGYLGRDINGDVIPITLYDKFLKRNGWAVVYDGTEDANGIPTRAVDTGWTNNNIRAGSPTYDPYGNLSGNTQSVLGRNLKYNELPTLAQYDGWVPQGLTNWDVFDARKHLISGSIDYYSNDFDRKIASLEAVSKSGNFGIELSFAKEKWTRDSYVAAPNPVIDIDTNYSLTVGPNSLFGDTNPNFGRLYFFAQLANKTLNTDERETKRVTAFAKYNFEEKHENTFLKWFGRHTFTALYDDHTLDQKQFLDTPMVFGNEADDELRPQATIFQRLWSGIFYLSDPYLQAFEDPNFQLSDFSTSGLAPSTRVTYPVGHQIPIAYNDKYHAGDAGKHNPFGDEVTAVGEFTPAFGPYRGVLSKTKTESKAFNVQSYFLKDHLVANLGWREDEVSLARNSNPPNDANLIPIRDPEVFNLDDTPVDVEKSRIFSYGLVLKAPTKWMPEGTSLSFHYGESENFVPNPGGFDMNGVSVPGSSGTTKEYGVTVSLMDNKLVARLNAYRGEMKNERFTALARAFTLFGNRDVARGLNDLWKDMDKYDRNRDGLFDVVQDPNDPSGQTFIDPDANQNGLLDVIEPGGAEYVEGATYMPLDQFITFYEGFEAFVSDWAREQAPLTQVPGTISGSFEDTVVAAGQGLQDALTDTTDLIAEGLEFELTYNPIPNFRLALNVTQQEAKRSNIAPRLGSYFDYMVGLAESVPTGAYLKTGSDKLTNPLATTAHASSTITGRFLNQSTVGGAYYKYVALEGTSNPEVRKYRVNMMGNYSFTEGVLNGVNLGAAYRWQDKAAIGYATTYEEYTGAAISDVSKPYYDDGFKFFDIWCGYKRKIFNNKVDWKIQLNIRNLFADGDPIPVQTQPDGSIARVSIPVPRQFVLSNSFNF